MGRKKCSSTSDEGLKKGSWTEEEDQKLFSFVKQHGERDWKSLPQKAGLIRSGKSCRLRWANYLRPGIKRGHFTPDEEDTILKLHATLGNRWATIARHLYKRTDNEIKNYWNTRLKKRVAQNNNIPSNPNNIVLVSVSDTSSSSSSCCNQQEKAKKPLSETETNSSLSSSSSTSLSSSSSSSSARVLNLIASKARLVNLKKVLSEAGEIKAVVDNSDETNEFETMIEKFLAETIDDDDDTNKEVFCGLESLDMTSVFEVDYSDDRVNAQN